ncbi:hypothetical protein XELAEV_18024385mg [Xenopus laevis]|uniref:Uncharacterized protein n=1 Tax=Xenopus laevis TaxID=8355 RepID=A0A974CXW4_XENLA|nr:hypothetical protein XELAEV_18024385mg [Xenopus laevis]
MVLFWTENAPCRCHVRVFDVRLGEELTNSMSHTTHGGANLGRKLYAVCISRELLTWRPPTALIVSQEMQM